MLRREGRVSEPEARVPLASMKVTDRWSLLQEVTMTTARAGAPAPQFSGMAYVDGGFKKVSLSDYAGEMGGIVFLPGRLHLCLTDRTLSGRGAQGSVGRTGCTDAGH